MQTKKALLKRLKAEGFTAGYITFILKYENRGQLKVRRNPLNNHRMFTEEDIDGIIEAVRRDGDQFKWSYDE